MGTKIVIFLILGIFLISFVQADTTFFDDQDSFFIMVNHSFLKHGLSGTSPQITEEPKPEIVVETKEIAEVIKVIKVVPFYVWFLVTFLFLVGWRRKRKYKSVKKKLTDKEKQEKQKKKRKIERQFFKNR